MTHTEFKTEFSALDRSLSSVLRMLRDALIKMESAPRGEKLAIAIDEYESLCEKEVQIRADIKKLNRAYMNHLESLVV